MRIACRVWLAAAVMAAACSQERITSSGGTGGPPAVASKLAFTVPPGNTTAGVVFKPAVAVTIEDSSGHVTTDGTNAVTVKIDTGLAGLSGTTTVKAVNGVATFGDLSIQKSGSAYFLTASSPGLVSATSAPFAIAPAAPSQLAFIVQPTSTDSAVVIAPAVQLAILDAFANSVPNVTNAVTIAIANNPGGATLSGTTTASAVNGIATFSDLSLNQGGNGYTLAATASGLSEATSRSFNIRVPLALAAVSAGSNYSCGITRAGAAYCWGAGSGGALGNGDTTGGPLCLVSTNIFETYSYIPCDPNPLAVLGGLGFGALSAGGGQTCGLTLNGAPYCWGETATGAQSCRWSITQDVKNGSLSAYVWVPCSSTPLAVSGGLTFVALSTGGGPSTCGLTPAGAAYCWGANSDGQLGTGDATYRSQPVLVSGGLTFAAVSAGGRHACGLTAAGAAYCWGYNGDGELGNGTTTNSATPVAVSGGIAFKGLSAGGNHTCGVTAAGSAYCWGYNGDGALGDGTNNNSTTPVAVAGGLGFTAVSAGGRHTCGLTSAGAAYCWGYRTGTNSAIPVAVSGGIVFTSISAGGSHTCGVTAAGAVYCWGSNVTGQLGIDRLPGLLGIYSFSSVPVRVQ